jgi:chemotaxis family two-component system response regulator Rcp1
MKKKYRKEANILLVEDNEGDIVLTLEAFMEAKINNCIHVVKDGEQALQFLRKEGRFKEAETPDFIFLDINLPKIDGKEVLAEIKKDEVLMKIPVVMLSTSNSEKDIKESFHHRANYYITKPLDFQKLREIEQNIKDFPKIYFASQFQKL